MGVDLGQHLGSVLQELRFTPTGKRVRASRAGVAVIDSRDALLVWEPRRVVPGYAVPVADVLVPLTEDPPGDLPPVPADLPPYLLPGQPFGWHLTPGTAFTLQVGEEALSGAAFRPDDADLGGRLVIDGDLFDWTEEGRPAFGHPHDPFHRIDVLPSDRHVVVALDGEVLADSRRPVAVFETGLPVRWYLPAEDVRTDLLTPSPTRTVCAYKGEAAYWSVRPGGTDRDDLVWSYPEPLPEADGLRGLLCFYGERVDLRLVDEGPGGPG